MGEVSRLDELGVQRPALNVYGIIPWTRVLDGIQRGKQTEDHPSRLSASLSTEAMRLLASCHCCYEAPEECEPKATLPYESGFVTYVVTAVWEVTSPSLASDCHSSQLVDE